MVSTHHAFRRACPDVILITLYFNADFSDGWEATRRLKNDSRTAHIPVVALTAHDGSASFNAPRERLRLVRSQPCRRTI